MANILLIDDEPDVRDSIGKVLERHGHKVSSCAGAAEGLAHIEDHPVDIVITDLIMPGMNGVEVIKLIRKSSPETRIIAVSGGGNFGSAAYQPNAITTTAYLEAAADAGADFVLTKPFDLSELRNAVDSVAPG